MEETSKQVRKLAHLARLSLTPEEEGELAGRLEQMVGYFQALSQVEDGEAAEAPSAVPFRPDGVAPSLDRDKLLENTPQVRDGYVVTPRSVGEGGEA